MCRVEISLAATLTRQTVQAVLRVFASRKPCQPQFPHTIVRCSSSALSTAKFFAQVKPRFSISARSEADQEDEDVREKAKIVRKA